MDGIMVVFGTSVAAQRAVQQGDPFFVRLVKQDGLLYNALLRALSRAQSVQKIKGRSDGGVAGHRNLKVQRQRTDGRRRRLQVEVNCVVGCERKEEIQVQMRSGAKGGLFVLGRKVVESLRVAKAVVGQTERLL